MKDAFDLVVVGGGVIGLSVAWYASKCCKKTVLLEQHCVEASSGSSRGSSRMFGEIFTEGIHYKLARQSRHFWREIESETETELLHMNGGLDIYMGAGCQRQATEDASKMPKNSNLELLSEKTFHARYPQWQSNAKSVKKFRSPGTGCNNYFLGSINLTCSCLNNQGICLVRSYIRNFAVIMK